MNIIDRIKDDFVFFEGGMGTLLQARGLMPGELPETWNILKPDVITEIHSAYLNAGCNIIKTNTFGANILKYSLEKDNDGISLESVIEGAVLNAKKAIKNVKGENSDDTYIALDIGPLGKLLKPLGTLAFEDAVEIFAQTVRIGVKCGVDLILIETMNDAYELKAAVLAAKENSDLPVFATCAFDEKGKLMTGADVKAVIALLEGLRVDALGMNCSLGPKQLKNFVSDFSKYSSLPVIVCPNAGLPAFENGKTVFKVLPEEFAEDMADIASMGGRILGGCCGTTPEHMRAVTEKLESVKPCEITEKNYTFVSSYTHAVEIGNAPVLIGERINPTGKAKLKAALREHNIEYILNEGVRQQEKNVDILDVNVGLPEINEAEMLCEAVYGLQEILDLPLQLDTSDAEAMEKALRIYNGKPMINSVCGKTESMKKIFPLAAKYGGVIVALTLDENGIPNTAEGRAEIAEKIYKTALSYGIKRKDIIVDTLAMTVSSDSSSALTTLEALKIIRDRFGGNTILGVSNISFGLPARDVINSTFFALAMQNGLSAAIMNPHSKEMMSAYYSFKALCNMDENCAGYIECMKDYAGTVSAPVANVQPAGRTSDGTSDRTSSGSTRGGGENTLQKAIMKGLKKQAAAEAEILLESMQPLEVVNSMVIPALDCMGKGFEKGEIYLPQLLMCAEAAKEAFEIIKGHMKKDDTAEAGASKGSIVLATVKGDIHDIGKNIVKVLLENYGYNVIDLGKDIPPEDVVCAVKKNNIKLVGLSALMTTTVPAMAETIKLLHESDCECCVVVGGAVLTEEYAQMINADKYAADAMETVRYAERIFLGK
ncbi:MAG: homocysteine S-methyltransferase family protein [Clostridia bacterium]|nr:homocysteine S-methyltransferase family protein [Clostridia bacterium]